MAKRSITQRWLIYSVGIIFILLLAIAVGLSYGIKNYYYSSVTQQLNSRINMISSVLLRYSESTSANFAAEVRGMVESFEDKEMMELMAINSQGRVVMTSSGFTPIGDEVPTDFLTARTSSNQTGLYVGEIRGGEQVMAMSVLVPQNKSGYEAMRLVVSLDEVDRQIGLICSSIFVICTCVLGVMIFSGLYFVKSIVIPVRQIGATARRLAVGDFSVRIQKRSNDEIGELCDIINHMADELSATDQVKNDFISSVSHELRTPLTAIKGWAETLNGIDDPETVQKGMRVITNESERLAGMVDELLDFSRIQNGRFVLNKEHIDILAELGEAVLIYRDRTRREEIELIYNEPAILPVVFGDKNRIRQVFINIIDNAIKYTDKGGTITIDAYAQNDEIVIVIADTGCGIPAADLPKIKTKFFKANYSQRGSGIGLAVAEEIITMHSGKIFVDSIEGEGTTITITIPAEQRAETAKPAVEAISTPKQEVAPQEQDRKSEMEE